MPFQISLNTKFKFNSFKNGKVIAKCLLVWRDFPFQETPSDIINKSEEMRKNVDSEFEKVFVNSNKIAEKVDVEIRLQRIVQTQTKRAN